MCIASSSPKVGPAYALSVSKNPSGCPIPQKHNHTKFNVIFHFQIT
jgi:hypothetical protein